RTAGRREGLQSAGTRAAPPEGVSSAAERKGRALEGAVAGAVGGAAVSTGGEVASRTIRTIRGRSAEREGVTAAGEEATARAAAGAAVPGVEVPPGAHQPPQETRTEPEPPPEPVSPPEAAEGQQEPPPAPEDWQEERRRLEREAYTDPATGLGNKRAQQQHIQRLEGSGEPADYVALDLEALSARNNQQGEEAGDDMIRRASVALAQAADEPGIEARNLDRHGGDEFSAIVPKGQGAELLQRARELMGEHPIEGTTFANRLGGAVGSSWGEAATRLAEYKRSRPKERQSRNLPTEEKPSLGVVRVPTESVVSRPEQMQFKSNVDPETGAGQELKGVQKWNPNLAGVISVWRDPASGETVVINGHHRLELAKRLGVEELDVRYVEAPNAQSARAIGAFINIAEGRGTATDVAKFMRDTGASQADLEEQGVSLRGDLAKKGVSLSRLAPDLFDQVATGKLDEGHAAAIGEQIADPSRQREAFRILRQHKGRISQAEVRELARQIEAVGSETTTQETLFG